MSKLTDGESKARLTAVWLDGLSVPGAEIDLTQGHVSEIRALQDAVADDRTSLEGARALSRLIELKYHDPVGLTGEEEEKIIIDPSASKRLDPVSRNHDNTPSYKDKAARGRRIRHMARNDVAAADLAAEIEGMYLDGSEP